MSSTEETPSTSSITPITHKAAVVSALPITVQSASHNSPAFVNLSVGELLQKQRRVAVVTMPASRSSTSSSVGMGNRFPIKPISRQSLTENTVPRPPSYPLDSNKLKESVAETSQLNVVRKLNVVDTVKTEGVVTQQVPGSTSILGSSQLDDLIRQIDPTSILDDPVKTMLTEFVDDFVDQVIERSCKVSHHRGSDSLHAIDVDFILRRYYNYPAVLKREPQTKSDNAGNAQKNTEVVAHSQRLALIKKTLKKP